MKEESTPPVPVTESRILFYQSEDGTSRIAVRLEEGTVWLPQVLIADLYQTTKQNISLHIRNIFDEGELQPGWFWIEGIAAPIPFFILENSSHGPIGPFLALLLLSVTRYNIVNII